jgi:hypothetical protein
VNAYAVAVIVGAVAGYSYGERVGLRRGIEGFWLGRQ